MLEFRYREEGLWTAEIDRELLGFIISQKGNREFVLTVVQRNDLIDVYKETTYKKSVKRANKWYDDYLEPQEEEE